MIFVAIRAEITFPCAICLCLLLGVTKGLLQKCDVWAHAIPKNDVKLMTEPYKMYTGHDLTECFKSCREETKCLAFNFNSADNECELLDTYYCAVPSNLTFALNFKYYDILCFETVQLTLVKQRMVSECLINELCSPRCDAGEIMPTTERPIQAVCSTSADCKGESTQCRDNICKCIDGYSFYSEGEDCYKETKSRGKTFVAAFMEHPGTVKPSLFISNLNNIPATYIVNSAYLQSTATLGAFSSTEVFFPGTIVHKGNEITGTNGITSKCIEITSDHDIAVQGSSVLTFSHGKYIVLSEESLGKQYYTISWKQPKVYYTMGTQMLIIATESQTHVLVTLPNYPDVTLTLNGIVYGPNDTIDLNLNKHQTVEVQCWDCDLTGSFVSATKAVAVFSGNRRIHVGLYSSSDHMVDQVPPVNTWGCYFIILPMHDSTGAYVKIVTSQPDTYLTLRLPTRSKTVYLSNSGSTTHFDVGFDKTGSLRSNKPILVTMFYKSTFSSNGLYGDPGMLVVPPTEQYTSPPFVFDTSTFEPNVYKYITVVIDKKYKQGILLDGIDIFYIGASEYDIPGDGTYRYITIQISNGVHVVDHLDKTAKFLAISFARSSFASYAQPLGQNLNILRN